MDPVAAVMTPEVAELCRKHNVRRLELFGSAVEGRFDPATSDYDFLVEFGPWKPGDGVPYFKLLFALEDHLGRSVDLVETAVVDNPYFLERINRTRKVVYET